jgi:histidine ammonia-lyase
MRALLLGERPLTVADIAALASGEARIGFAPRACAAIDSGHAALLRFMETGGAVYGVTTGLGAAVDTRLSLASPLPQHRIPLARSVGVGAYASPEQVRAIMAARLARLAQGCSGISLSTAEALASVLNAAIHPLVPMTGSVGEADLAPLAHIAAVVFGAGEAEVDGATIPGAAALARFGLTPPEAGPKDGLALVSSNAASVGLGALVVHKGRRVLAGLLAAACLSLEGFRANLSPVSAAAVPLHPVPGFDRVAECLGEVFADSALIRPGAARRLQDPLSFRCLGPVHAAALSALDGAQAIIEIELNSSDDNPAILAEQSLALPTASFDATHLALAFEGLGLALSRAAALAGERVMQLMSPVTSDLPRFLAPPLEGRSGFSALQKTVSALVAEIQFRASPMPAVILPVADRIEDYGTMAMASVLKAEEILDRLRILSAIELIVAAQACDVRAGILLQGRMAALYRMVREIVRHLEDDRPAAPDIANLVAALQKAEVIEPFLL